MTYALNHISRMLYQAADFAEAEGDFVPLRKWIHELNLAAAENDAPSQSGPAREADLVEQNAGDALDPRTARQKADDEFLAEAEATRRSDYPI
jgi:hypothetical protein